MIRKTVSGLLLASVLAVNPASHVLANPFVSAPTTEANVIKVQWGPGQEHREYCWRLRNRADQLHQDIHYASSPWERDQMERHLWRVRERLRGECWGGRG